MRARLVEAAVVAVAALVVLLCLFLQELRPPELRGDQEWVNLVVIKTLHPTWFMGDGFFGSDYYLRYNPAFVRLQAALTRRNADDPVAALRVLYFPMGFLFLVGHYVLFRLLTGRPLAAGLGTLSAMTVRNAFGGEYWGFDGLSAVQPRTIGAAFTPLLICLFFWWRSRRYFPSFFLLLGGIGNLHPVSGFHLAQLTGTTYLLLARFRFPAWKQVVTGALLFTLVVAPFILAYIPGTENVADPRLAPAVRAALEYRFDYAFLPLGLNVFLSVAFHSSLGLAVLLWLRQRERWTDELRLLVLLGGIALVLGFGGTALIQAWAVLANRPYLDIQQLRATKFMYLPLVAAFPMAYQSLMDRRTTLARIGLVGLFAVSLVPPAFVIHSFSAGIRDQVKALLGVSALGVSARRAPPPTVDGTRSIAAQEELWQWVSRNTERNDLFFSDSIGFRVHTLRPITASWKDSAMIIGGTAPFYRWFLYLREVDKCRAVHGAGCWFELAQKSRARYVIVDPDVERATPDEHAVRVWSREGWSIWRLDR